MKNILLGVGYFLTCFTAIQAQLLYGVTEYGGIYGSGAIIKFTAATNNLTVEKSFTDNGLGLLPQGTPIQAPDGKLYGTTLEGGTDNAGVIYSFDPSSSTYTKLKDFNNDYIDDTTGSYPLGSMVLANDGKMYGMTTGGGHERAGVIFSFNPVSHAYTKLKDFGFLDGYSIFSSRPAGHSLIQAADGKLYGTTDMGGDNNEGVLFSFDPATLTYKKLKDFDGTNGSYPYGSPIQASDGKIYGSAGGGLGDGYGVIFSFDPSTSTYKVVYYFDGSTGFYPIGDLVEATDGKLYSMTYGAYHDGGTLFSFDPATSICTKLKSFDAPTGAHPESNLMQASNGKLYSMTYEGGNNNKGVIFSFGLSASTYEKLQDFNGANGAYPAFGSGFVEIACTTRMAYYKDADGDGYGNPYKWKIVLSKPAGYIANNTDCDDNNKAVHGPVTYYRDEDGDGFGDARVSTLVCGTAVPAGYVINNADDNDKKVLQYELSNYPNPFEGTSTIKYKLPSDSKVSIKVYDVTGIVVATLVDENKPAGIYSINFNAASSVKRFLYYKITAQSKNGQFTQTNKMIQLQ